jgi:4-hydroxyphenylpyruvate dioxygenase-like putative hemolysin
MDELMTNAKRAKELQTKLSLPQVSQIGVVVRDLHRAVQYYSDIFGLGPFTVYEFEPDKQWFMEELSPCKAIQAKAMWGNIELELVQPIEGRSLFREFLSSHGEGLQHLGFNVRNYEEVFERMKKSGFTPLMRVESYSKTYGGNFKACTFDTRDIGGVLFEIIWKSWLPECQ